MGWTPFLHEGRSTAGTIGSEGGVIVSDEEYENAARITLEEKNRNAAPVAITCGIYGWMMHTRFFSNAIEARHSFEEMKVSLALIVDSIPAETEPNWQRHIPQISAAIHAFVEKYPT